MTEGTAGTTYADLVDRHLADPGPGTLGPLRSAVRASPTFDPDLDPGQVARLLDAAPDTAARALAAMMPGALLSPVVHTALAQALDRLGRAPEASRQRRLARAALRGIVASGDGTRARPWTVLRVSDEYDVLRSLGRRPASQELVGQAGRELDRIECVDGSEAWFDAGGLVVLDA
jgi:hypothetical protein